VPEGYNKPKWRVRPVMGLARAAELGRLIKLRCRQCKRTAYFLPADLVDVYGDMEVDHFRLPCSACRTDRMVIADLHTPQPGDWGKLDVRRPRRVETLKWYVTKLGDPAARAIALDLPASADPFARLAGATSRPYRS